MAILHSSARSLLVLTDTKRFKEVVHSYLPCDWDFSIINRKLKNHRRFFSIHQLTKCIITKKFIANEILFSEDQILNFEQLLWSRFYKRNCVSLETSLTKRNEKQDIAFSTFSRFTFENNLLGCITALPFFHGIIKQFFYYYNIIS